VSHIRILHLAAKSFLTLVMCSVSVRYKRNTSGCYP